MLTVRFLHSEGGGFPHNVVRKIICTRTRSPWNHCIVVLQDGRIVESGYRHGVYIGKLEFKYARYYKDIYLDIDEQAFLRWLEPRLGNGFDLLAMIAQLVPGCRWHREGLYYCSTLMTEFLGHLDHSITFDKCLSPGELERFLSSSPLLFNPRSSSI